MPQIKLEYTRNLPVAGSFGSLLHDIHLATSRIAGINLANCKSRCYPLEDFYVGGGNVDGRESAFVHLEVRFIEGRSTEVKQTLANELNELVRAFFKETCDGYDMQFTVEVSDILVAEYAKHPEGTLTVWCVNQHCSGIGFTGIDKIPACPVVA